MPVLTLNPSMEREVLLAVGFEDFCAVVFAVAPFGFLSAIGLPVWASYNLPFNSITLVVLARIIGCRPLRNGYV